ncbi:hypothetical protein [Gracilibacillus timonensis]|uniref:hypothetical protein n=1 Tax=Gracilibacillus timonensis TaxID=1816696 RepID=UPI0008261944|nr:hypothetical protein [Gracilibacillus timonensis]
MSNKFLTNVMSLWFPILIAVSSIYFLSQKLYIFVFGLILLGITMDDNTLIGKPKDQKADENHPLLERKAHDLTLRLIYSLLIIFIVIHYFFIQLEAGFVLALLLLMIYSSSMIGTFYLRMTSSA